MRILITNDDGYLAPGLEALVQACQGLGELEVFAPEQNSSGMSNSLTLNRPLTISKAANGFYYVNGTPSDCVHLALTSNVLAYKPDLVVSGINNGANLGDDTLYSGTVAAAMEGYLFGIPAIAFSLVQKNWTYLAEAKQVAQNVLHKMMDHILGSPPWLLNINIPADPNVVNAPWKITRLGRRHASEPAISQTNPRGERIYWIGPAGEAREAGAGTDFHTIDQKQVSITPLQIDLTDYHSQNTWAKWLDTAE